MASFLSQQNSSPRASVLAPLSESTELLFPSQAEYYHIDDPSLLPSYPSFSDSFSDSLDKPSFATRIRTSKQTTSSQRLLQRKEMEKRGNGGKVREKRKRTRKRK
jgi:hypothetical protein